MDCGSGNILEIQPAVKGKKGGKPHKTGIHNMALSL